MQNTRQSDQGQSLSCSDEYLQYLLNLRQESLDRLESNSLRDQGQEWESSNRNDENRRLRDRENDLRLYGYGC